MQREMKTKILFCFVFWFDLIGSLVFCFCVCSCLNRYVHARSRRIRRRGRPNDAAARVLPTPVVKKHVAVSVSKAVFKMILYITRFLRRAESLHGNVMLVKQIYTSVIKTKPERPHPATRYGIRWLAERSWSRGDQYINTINNAYQRLSDPRSFTKE